MAQFTGYQCDGCGAVIEKDDRTKKRVRYEGSVVEGDIDSDLCPDCITAEVDGLDPKVEIKPIPRRKRKSAEQAQEDTPQVAAEQEAVAG